MTVKLIVDMGNAFKKAPWPSPKERKKLNRIMALKVIEVIKSRVHSGFALGASGRSGGATSFIGYSESYKKYKQSIGRQPESVGDWLRLTGKMLASMGILEIDANHWVVGFSGSRPNTRPRSKSARTKERKRQKAAFKPYAKYFPLYEKGEGFKLHREALAAQKARAVKNVSNALLAWANDQLRPFVGLTEKEKGEVIDHTMQHWTERL